MEGEWRIRGLKVYCVVNSIAFKFCHFSKIGKERIIVYTFLSLSFLTRETGTRTEVLSTSNEEQKDLQTST
jgi:hypothetical protein